MNLGDRVKYIGSGSTSPIVGTIIALRQAGSEGRVEWDGLPSTLEIWYKQSNLLIVEERSPLEAALLLLKEKGYTVKPPQWTSKWVDTEYGNKKIIVYDNIVHLTDRDGQLLAALKFDDVKAAAALVAEVEEYNKEYPK